MRHLLKWHLFIILLGTFVSPYCYYRGICPYCQETSENVFQMRCYIPKAFVYSDFNVTYELYKSMTVNCVEGPVWWMLGLKEGNEHPYVESISFRHCGLPWDRTIFKVVTLFVNEDIRELDFQAFFETNRTINRWDLAKLKNLTRFTFSNNYLTEVPVDLLHDLVELKYLNMNHNLLTKLPTGFLDLPNLIFVDMSHNKLKSIESGLFDKLSNLRNLNLESNQLTDLPPAIFDNLTSLTSLSLVRNNLKQLPSGVFEKLKVLTIIDLSENHFTDGSIPRDVFRNNSYLEKFTLAHNKEPFESLPDKMFSGLDKLRTVYLNDNNFVKIPRYLLEGVEKIEEIQLSGNRITEIPVNLFRDCFYIAIISFRDNNITDLPMKMFHSLENVKTLDLSGNQLTEFNTEIFEYTRGLKILNLTDNRIERIRDEGYCSDLYHDHDADESYWINRRKNNDSSTEQSIYWESSRCAIDIEEIYLSGNRLEVIPDAWLPFTKLRILTLHDNAIKNLTIKNFQFYSGSTKITYGNNQIETISFEDFDNLTIHALRLEISIGSNPINCDCRLREFLKYRDSEVVKRHEYPIVVDMGEMYCSEPEGLRSTRISRLDQSALECLIEDPSALNATCPNNCQCWNRPEDQAYRIDCSYRNLTKAPESLQSPEGYHIELNLMGNMIKSMPSMTQPGYQNVTKLILSKNLVSDVDLNSLSEKLVFLTLDSNRLTKLEPDILDFFTNSKELTHLELQGNPWICSCETLDFLEFIQTNTSLSANLRNVTCDSLNYPIFQMTPEDMCQVSMGFIIVIGSVIAVLGLLIGSIAAIYHSYKLEIKVWLYAKQWCLCFITEDELDKDKVYDAFISFSHMDDPLVVETLVPTLEAPPQPYRLCVHYRDWIPGEAIPQQIVHSVENSKRTIIVLSPNFLESVWSRIEFRAAHEQALSEGRARVIIVLYGDIGPIDNLDSEIKAYLKMNTYVKWEDPWFWQKLKYALPHSNNWQKSKKSKLKAIELLDQNMEYLKTNNTSHNSHSSTEISL